MEKDFSALIISYAALWDVSGALAVIKDGEVLFRNTYGKTDREGGGRAITFNDTYSFSCSSRLLLGLCAALLNAAGYLDYNSPLSDYIPEYGPGDKIKIKDILLHQSGIPDYLYGSLMLDLEKDGEHKRLPEEKRVMAERALCFREIPFREVLSLIEDKELEFTPGEREDEYSATNTVLTREIIERISGMSLYDFEAENIFKPLNIKITRGLVASTRSYYISHNTRLIRAEEDEKYDNAFTADAEGLLVLAKALCDNTLLTKKAFGEATRPNGSNIALLCENVNGFFCGEMKLLGYEAMIYFEPESSLYWIQVQNEEPKSRFEDGRWNNFRRQLREAIEEKTTYPKNARLVPYNLSNWVAAARLKVEDKQLEYVMETKDALCMALSEKKALRPFVLTEGKRAVGLILLRVDKKKDIYDIEIVLIDKRFQSRGYGRVMVSAGIEYLKRQGAKVLMIGVNRSNIPAQRLYLSLGFKVHLVYDNVMLLRLEL